MTIKEIKRTQDVARFDESTQLWTTKTKHDFEITTAKNEYGLYVVPEKACIPHRMWGKQCVNKDITWYD